MRAAPAIAVPLIELSGIGRDYPSGDTTICALRDVSFSIAAGEMVAIIGPSGSGKSTLMNLLGCLDRPTHGRYAIAGKPVGEMDADELADLRRQHFGFVFQRYQLLNSLSAIGNVEVPALYAGVPAAERHARASALLDRLGLGDRQDHRPTQLSGGQQQRVSIARALINGGDVILADEPTGALDRASGQEVMAILKELHALGHTIILVTHSAEVAAHADRIIELQDGRIVRDEPVAPVAPVAPVDPQAQPALPGRLPLRSARRAGRWGDLLGRTAEAVQMASRSMASHRLRTALTMLGIVIGIASVVSIVALGDGSREKLRRDLSAFGTNTIDIYAGREAGDPRAAQAQALNIGDVRALGALDYVDAVSPIYELRTTLRRGNVEVNAFANGVSEVFFQVAGRKLAQGMVFDRQDVRLQSQVVVIDDKTREALFKDGSDPGGQVILMGSVPMTVIGVTRKDSGLVGFGNQLSLWIPYTTATTRLIGQDTTLSIKVLVKDSVSIDAAEAGMLRLLRQRHGSEDFFVNRIDTVRKQIEQVTGTITLLISSIALIALLVGGIGVMNIMLVSVVERTQEIGVRMAVGARQADILRQFLIEAIMVCLIGGAVGVGLALLAGAVFNAFDVGIQMRFSALAIGGAFGVSTGIGLLFGFMPARNAARLDPVVALARE